MVSSAWSETENRQHALYVIIYSHYIQVERYSAYIDGYHIRFWPGRNNEEFSVESVSTDGETEAVLHSLAPWTEYTVAVQPFKDRFTGKFSEEAHVRTEEDGELVVYGL